MSNSVLTAIRMTPEMVADLKKLAKKESVLRRENVSWARLVREAATRMLCRANRRK